MRYPRAVHRDLTDRDVSKIAYAARIAVIARGGGVSQKDEAYRGEQGSILVELVASVSSVVSQSHDHFDRMHTVSE
jgi:FAD/FMN-containing dehydrogenase